MKERSKLVFRRFIWFILLVIRIVTLAFIVIKMRTVDDEFVSYYAIFYGISFADIFILSFFICSLTHSYKVYEYYGNIILIYAAWSQHYIKVNDEIKDEYSAFVFRTSIELYCTLYDGTELHATISTSNRIKLKINGVLYRQYQKGRQASFYFLQAVNKTFDEFLLLKL